MAAADILYLFLWIWAVVPSGLGCPQLCSCSDKYSRHVAECSYKDMTAVPRGFPSNVSTVSLSANRISWVPVGSFRDVTQVTSLWMAHNEIGAIEPGTIAPLVHLRNLDISHNKIKHFPWEDLENLTSLHLLKMNHNKMSHLPADAFANLKDLRSLRINNNRFTTIAQGTFDGLVSLSHLQIYNNPFACTCSLDWLRDWIATATISVAEQKLIVCESPDKLKGEVIGDFPESKCSGPNVTIRSDTQNWTVTEGNSLVLTCVFTGNPKPLVMWRIRSRSRNQELVLPFTEDDSSESNEDSAGSHQSIKVFNNGTLIVPRLRREDGGNYSCSATNEVGRAEDEVEVKVAASLKPAAVTQLTTRPTYTHTLPTRRQTERESSSDSLPKDLAPTVGPTEMTSPQYDKETRTPSGGSKCGLTANTKLISSHVFSGSPDDVKQYTFDFGVIALGVSETEATVRLNPLLVVGEKTGDRAAGDTSSEIRDLSDRPESADGDGLYLCVTTDRKHSAVQWSRIKDGVNTYLFRGLRPGTNYSLCLTYRGDDCEVQVLFTTRRRVPNLLIIISVSICLLTVSTVPLLGATCFHLVYMYRGKTYKLILKAKNQYQSDRNITVNFKIQVPLTDSHKKINGSQLDEEEEEEEVEEDEESESVDGVKEADTEESVVTESLTLSQCRGNLDDCEVGSEYSDRLPLGAEAVNITNNYKYPNQ